MKKKNIEKFLEILTVIVHAQPVFRNDKFKDRSSDDTYLPYSPRLHLFPRMKLFSRLIFWCITLSFAAHLSPRFPRKTREIYGVTSHGSHGCSPFKTWIRGSTFDSIPPLFHSSSIYSEIFRRLRWKRNEFEFRRWHLLFVRTKNSPPIVSFESFPMKSYSTGLIYDVKSWYVFRIILICQLKMDN